jgi:hypothetical protein
MKGDGSEQRVRRPYGGFSLWGVPYSRVDMEYAAVQIRELYFDKFEYPNGPMRAILEYNEKIVSRCGILMSFSGILIAVFLFAANNPRIITSSWQRWGVYASLTVWIVTIVRLLLSLRHQLPPPWEFGSDYDIDTTIKIFIRRMGYYNLALVASTICFVVIFILLAPIGASLADHIFGLNQ